LTFAPNTRILLAKKIERQVHRMFRHVFTVSALALVIGCNGTNPFFDTDASTPDVIGDVELPPEVEQPPTATPGSILRYEELNSYGGGYAESVVYNSGDDTFEVDNIAFDGLNVYNLSALAMGAGPVGEIGGYVLFDADVTVPDFLTGNPVSQIVPYHAIYGESAVLVDGEPRSRFAIVRTGGYADYGFGGFIYERNGTVVLPPAGESGQAGFSGRYAGMRVFSGMGGLEFTEGDMQIAIDFGDFNETHAVSGLIYNRVAYDESGTPILLGTDGSSGELPLPNLHFVIEANVDTLNSNGEIAGKVISTYIETDENEAVDPYEEGFYYGIISGDTTGGDGGELVGILVFESDDPRHDNVSVQETGGFILLRN